MSQPAGFQPGAKVTVITSHFDPSELSCNPHMLIAAVEPLPDGEPGYVVEQPGVHQPRRFGPFPAARLTPGWKTR